MGPRLGSGRSATVEVDGHRLALSNLDKVLYPGVGTTKAEVIDYYARVAPVMVPHLAGRGITLRRFPDGVDGTSFYEKRCPGHRPRWVGTQPGPGDSNGTVHYCVLDSTASLVWAANIAGLEVHAPMASTDIDQPTLCVFDLDPGAPAAIAECAEVALDLRHVLDELGLVAVAKTSGATGLQVYVPLNSAHTHEQCAEFARAIARLLERARPDLVTSNMRKDLRVGKVLIDWSQNSRHKTTIAAYSLRARPSPTVSTPLSWDEVEAAVAGAPLSFEAHEVIDRVEASGDLFEAALTVSQKLPDLAG